MAIGSIGKLITFETSDKRILTPQGFKKEVSGRWATHARILKKPRRQFLGPDTVKITFAIVLDAVHGVKPRKTLKAIEKDVKKGTPRSIVIGGKKVVSNKVTINSVSETWDEVWDKGELVRATVELSIEEYPK